MKEKRELPRNVDNTIKICSVMPLKNLLFVSPVVTAIGGMVLLEPSPFSLFAGGISASFVIALGCEFNKELGVDIFRSIIEYKKNGDITFDRSTELTPVQRRFINRDTKGEE